mmetsp:Transcript_28244/g.33187  ORF Transcript_28244/g.33187 Transcript_28244/m.33187 type:complete len:277 (+) Transcript_28244:190-1020(+)
MRRMLNWQIEPMTLRVRAFGLTKRPRCLTSIKRTTVLKMMKIISTNLLKNRRMMLRRQRQSLWFSIPLLCLLSRNLTSLSRRSPSVNLWATNATSVNRQKEPLSWRVNPHLTLNLHLRKTPSRSSLKRKHSSLVRCADGKKSKSCNPARAKRGRTKSSDTHTKMSSRSRLNGFLPMVTAINSRMLMTFILLITSTGTLDALNVTERAGTLLHTMTTMTTTTTTMRQRTTIAMRSWTSSSAPWTCLDNTPMGSTWSRMEVSRTNLPSLRRGYEREST